MRQFSTPSRRTRTLWGIFFGVIIAAYTVAFIAVIARAAGFRGDAPVITAVPGTVGGAGVLTSADVTATADRGRDIATPVPTIPPTPIPPTPTPVPPSPTPTPTPDPETDFRVPLSLSNTGGVHGYEVAILNITDGAIATGVRPRAGFKYIAIEASIANQTPNPMPPGTWTIRTAQGQEYDISRVGGFGTPLPATIIAPNARVSGVIVFEVPTTAKLQWIRFRAPQFPKGDLFFEM